MNNRLCETTKTKQILSNHSSVFEEMWSLVIALVISHWLLLMSLNPRNLLLHKNKNISYFHLYTATATFQMPMDIFRNDNIKISQIAKNV